MMQADRIQSENKDNPLYMGMPNFVFIYTINLDGKIDFYSRMHEKNGDFKDINEYYQEKDNFFEELLEDDLFSYTKVDTSNLNYFIDKDFLTKSILSFWIIEREKYDLIIDSIVEDVNNICIASRKRKCELRCCLLNAKDNTNLETKELFTEELKVKLSNNIEIKLYSSGVIGLNFELEIINEDPNLEFSASSFIDLINYPNLVAGKHVKEFYKCNLQSNNQRFFQPGYLNVISYEIANDIFHKFMSLLKKNKKKSDLLRIEKIEPFLDAEMLKITKRYDKGLYGGKRIDAVPYIGVIMKTLPEWVIDHKKAKDDNIKPAETAKLLSAMASQTKEFLFRLADADNFLLKNNISRGTRDSIIIDRRGFSTIGARKESPPHAGENCGEHNDEYYFLQFRLNALKIMVFCIESTFATTKSVYGFNKELEEFVSKKINFLLKSDNVIGAGELAKYVKIISKARTLSPCEDLTSNIIPFLKSHIGIECSKRIKQFGLDTLIESSQRRLGNYGNFLRTNYDIQKTLQSEENINQLKLIAYSLLGIASFIALIFVFLLLK